MKNSVALLLLVLLIASCGDKPFEKLGSIAYQRGMEACEDDKNHWLFDLQAQNSKDSIYQNTLPLKGKLEIHKLQLDSSTHLYTLLSQTCKGDSIKLHMDAKTFYSSLNGTVPYGISEKEQIKVTLWVRDKLTDLQHIAFKKTFESHAMDQYIKSNRWGAERDSATGIYLDRLKQNSSTRGEHTKVLVSYTISNLNGRVIAKSTDDDPLAYSKNDKGILKGIRLVVDNLAVGESARALVPSSYAYGASGNGVVAGYVPVIIEIEVLEDLD